MISNYILIQSRQNCINYIFYSIKICFYYMNFSFDTFLVTISGLPFLFAKVRISLSVCKLNSSTIVKENC